MSPALLRLSPQLICTAFFIAFSLLGPALTSAQAQKNERVALVIGNGAYQHGNPLKNPAADAMDMAETLRACKFQLTTGAAVIDAGHEDMDRALEDFRGAATEAKVLLFFFAGHGLEVDGSNYIIPVDAQLEEKYQVKHRTVALNEILGAMAGDDRLKVVILDCCRDNPFGRSWSRSGSVGLAAPRSTPNGTILLYSAAPGQVAADGTGRNSPFTSVLKRELLTKGLEIEQVFKRVGQSVKQETRVQEPWMNSSFYGNFSFVEGEFNGVNPVPTAGSPPMKTRSAEEELVEFIRQYYRVGNIGSGEMSAEFFAPIVTSYYGKGKHNRDEVLADQRRHAERWPNRSVTITGEPTVVPGNETGSYMMVVSYEFLVSNPTTGKSIDGTGASVFGVRKSGSGWEIFHVEEKAEK